MDEDLPDKQPDQDDMHACQDLSDDDVVDIGGNCAHVVENLEEMVRDTMENDDNIDGEFAKVKQLVSDSKIPLYPGCKVRDTCQYLSDDDDIDGEFAKVKQLMMKIWRRWSLLSLVTGIVYSRHLLLLLVTVVRPSPMWFSSVTKI